MIKANELSIGSCIRHKNRIWKLTAKEHVKPGKGGAFIQATLKDTQNGTKLEERFSSDETIEKVMITKKECQYSYSEGDSIFVTDNETYETIEITPEHISKENMNLIKAFAEEELVMNLEYADDLLINAELPHSISVEVDIADPIVKGQTAASSYKSSVLKNGIKVAVPPYIKAGDKIVINPYGEKGVTFVSRV